MNNLDKIKIKLREFSVNHSRYTVLELYYELVDIVKSIIKNIDLIDDQFLHIFKELEYLLNEGLNIEVGKQIQKLYESGELEHIINVSIFNDLNNKISLIEKKKLGYTTYDEFGALGDGITDDYISIKKCHDYANEYNLNVKCLSGKTYYLDNVIEPIIVKTSIDFNGSSVVINENNIGEYTENGFTRNNDVYKIVSKHEPIVINNLTGIEINTNTRVIPQLAGHGKCLVDVINTTKKQFIRKGSNADTGYNQTDQFIIDNDGNVMSEIIWDFNYITSITLYPVDEDKLVIKNGTLITVENKYESKTYLRKGILINRSNVVIENMGRKVENYNKPCSPTRGIYYFHTCSNVVLRNCDVHSRRESQKDVGTYDLSYYKVVDYIVDNVTDLNYNNTSIWGVHTQNYGKNAYFNNCKLSRIDAHRGVWNLTILNTTIGKQINLIGGGRLYIDNVTTFAPHLVNFRSDYGSNWRGDIICRNILHISKDVTSSTGDKALIKVFYFNNNMTHDFGYNCYAGKSITVDNYQLINDGKNSNNKVFEIMSFGKITSSSVVEKCRMRFPNKLTFKNMRCDNGKFSILNTSLSDFRSLYDSYLSETGETYSTSAKNLYIEENTLITVDNVDLDSTITVTGLGTSASDDYTSEKKRVLPSINISNCNFFIHDVGGFPHKLYVANSIIRKCNCASGGCRHIATFVNTIFNCKPNDYTDLVYRVNGVTSSFINCYFMKPKYVDGSAINSSKIAECYTFLNYSSVKSGEESFRSNGSFIGCRIDNDIHPNTLFPNTKLFNYEFNSSYGLKYKK